MDAWRTEILAGREPSIIIPLRDAPLNLKVRKEKSPHPYQSQPKMATERDNSITPQGHIAPLVSPFQGFKEDELETLCLQLKKKAEKLRLRHLSDDSSETLDRTTKRNAMVVADEETAATLEALDLSVIEPVSMNWESEAALALLSLKYNKHNMAPIVRSLSLDFESKSVLVHDEEILDIVTSNISEPEVGRECEIKDILDINVMVPPSTPEPDLMDEHESETMDTLDNVTKSISEKEIDTLDIVPPTITKQDLDKLDVVTPTKPETEDDLISLSSNSGLEGQEPFEDYLPSPTSSDFEDVAEFEMGMLPPKCNYIVMNSPNFELVTDELRGKKIGRTPNNRPFIISDMIRSGWLDTAFMEYRMMESQRRHMEDMEKLQEQHHRNLEEDRQARLQELNTAVQELSDTRSLRNRKHPNMQCITCRKFDHTESPLGIVLQPFVCKTCMGSTLANKAFTHKENFKSNILKKSRLFSIPPPKVASFKVPAVPPRRRLPKQISKVPGRGRGRPRKDKTTGRTQIKVRVS